MNTLLSISESAKPAITNYLAYLRRRKRVEKIHLLLIQYTAESCPIPKNLGDIAKLLADIQKKWLENHWVFNIKSNSYYRSQLNAKRFSQIEEIDFDKLFSPIIC